MRTAAIVLIAGAVIVGAMLAVRLRSGGSGGAASPAARDQAAAPSGSSPTQRDGGEGAVEIEVTMVRPESADAAKYAVGAQTAFLVSMNTHSVDLAGYDLVRISELQAGERRMGPIRWVAISDNNHHRSGALIFPEVDRSTELELRIRGVAGVPVRIFRWAR